jgi:hypothetical protein
MSTESITAVGRVAGTVRIFFLGMRRRTGLGTGVGIWAEEVTLGGASTAVTMIAGLFCRMSSEEAAAAVGVREELGLASFFSSSSRHRQDDGFWLVTS